MSGRDWAATFDAAFRDIADAAVNRIWRGVYGEEYPEGIDPYSFVSRTELRLMAQQLGVGEGNVLADLGCGRGGPGLWLAGTTGAKLVGVDISAVAISAAGARAQRLGLADSASYSIGSFEQTGLGSATIDAIVSVDALLFAPDKRAALVEMARILRPAGRLVLTTWDYHTQPEGRPPQVGDHRPLLRDAGFTIEAYDETADWRERQQRVAAGLLTHADEIAAESGADPADYRQSVEEMRRTLDTILRRVFIVAVKRGPK